MDYKSPPNTDYDKARFTSRDWLKPVAIIPIGKPEEIKEFVHSNSYTNTDFIPIQCEQIANFTIKRFLDDDNPVVLFGKDYTNLSSTKITSIIKTCLGWEDQKGVENIYYPQAYDVAIIILSKPNDKLQVLLADESFMFGVSVFYTEEMFRKWLPLK
jgi:hypothetical protein